MLSGKCSYFIDKHSFEVAPGDIVLIPAGVIHRTGYDGNEHSRLLIECSLHYIPESVREGLGNMPYLYRNPSAEGELKSMLHKIEEEFKSPDEYSEQSLLTRMHALFFFLVRNRGFEGAITPKNMMIEDVISYIKKNYSTDIRLSSVAQSYFVSPEHLSRTFKRDTGFCFNEYLTLVRLQHAENMLTQKGKKTISEIAYSCGFNDSNYFSDKFKKVYGVSPLKYCKENT
jgi:AraC-like DNA-binding protein